MVGNNAQKYPAYRLWEYDFEMALALLPDIENTFFSKRGRSALLRDVVISYTRPFSSSRTSVGKLTLPESHIPKDLMALHKSLYQWRNAIIAHTDVLFRKPRFMEINSNVSMSFVGVDYQILLDNLIDINRLIVTALEEVKLQISNFENKARFQG